MFFPSYSLLEAISNTWRESGLWEQFTREMPVLVEPRQKEAFAAAMNEFKKTASAGSGGKGACLLAVCRGKVRLKYMS